VTKHFIIGGVAALALLIVIVIPVFVGCNGNVPERCTEICEHMGGTLVDTRDGAETGFSCTCAVPGGRFCAWDSYRSGQVDCSSVRP
jgi:hypothetical protein